MPKLLDVVAQCQALPVPVVLLDTCALLDLVREVGRPEADVSLPRQGVSSAARTLLNRATAPVPQVHLLHYELVPGEFETHVTSTSNGALTPFRKAVASINLLNQVATGLGLPAYNPGSLTEHDATIVVSGLVDLGRRLLANSSKIDPDTACERLAFDRSITAQAPASSGKPELKDCTIIEHYLALCQQLPVTTVKVFVSSNFRDYGDKSYRLKPPLTQQFAQVGLEWASDFIWAQGILDGVGRR